MGWDEIYWDFIGFRQQGGASKVAKFVKITKKIGCGFAPHLGVMPDPNPIPYWDIAPNSKTLGTSA